MKKVNLYSAIALRNECDEALPEVMARLGYSQSFFNTDFKLLVGYLSVGASALMYWLEKKYNNDFSNSDYVNYTTALVVVFFILNGIWVGFTKFVEKNVKYVGTKGSKKVTVSTKLKSKADPIYYITLADGKSTIQHTLELPKVFNSDGYLVPTELLKVIEQLVQKLEKNN
ncbi:hypothetical protein KL920_000529 [Ogataea angusta]|nr:hypothetical protein KL920_000529 [Ogataea angusta]